MSEDDKKLIIAELLSKKATLKQTVFEQTQNVFNNLREVLKKLEGELNNSLDKTLPNQIKLRYYDRGAFEMELKVAGDLLIFSMHSNIFEFDREHPVWKTDYITQNDDNTFSGVINVYNFLADSFKYNRQQDLGYLVGRLFINQEGHFMIEGKRQKPEEHFTGFSDHPLTEENLRMIVLNSVLYCIQFDLLAPPYDQIKIASVEQMQDKISHSKIQTGKRVGFKFNSDDV
ncbi:hypothetical protein EMN47_10555 [Prolixibacteraceae bacterium JC049]|jgi:hypothetical protein|nr:hypothetical protein [Prolixibacteraceae bacterium JC049]